MCHETCIKMLSILINKIIEWEDKYSTGVSIIDEEHKKLIDIVNKVIIARGHSNNPEKISKIAEKVCPFLTIMIVSLYFNLFLISENSLDKLLISFFDILSLSFTGEII